MFRRLWALYNDPIWYNQYMIAYKVFLHSGELSEAIRRRDGMLYCAIPICTLPLCRPWFAAATLTIRLI